MTLRTQLYTQLLRQLHAKQMIARLAHTPPRLPKGMLLPLVKTLFRSSHIEHTQVMGKDVITFTSSFSGNKKTSKASKPHLIFLHGGGYVYEALPTHWVMIKRLLNQLDCRISVVDYPLAPEHNYKDTFAMLSQTYRQLTKTYADDRFILMGDSAGGGLALAFNQKLLNEQCTSENSADHAVLPEKNILLSPWLDLSLSHPDIAKYERSDVILSRELLNYCATHYAGGDDSHQYLLSPINGELTDCPPTLVLYSDAELFYPECEALKARTQAAGLSQFTYQCHADLPHDWGISPLPEAKVLVDEVVGFIHNA